MEDDLKKEVVTSTTPVDVQTQLDEMQGAFVGSLTRNNKKIRADRALAIAEDAQMIFKRKIEDLSLEIKKIKRERESMLDLSPTNTDSLILATDFDAAKFVEKDLQLGIKIRNKEIELDIASERYTYLFGKL